MSGLLFLCLFVAYTMASPYCSMTGCADVTKCTCPPFFWFCSVQEDSVGTCTLTESGTWVIIGISILLLCALLLAIVLICCCCCCKCRGSKTVVHEYRDKPLSRQSV